MSYLMTHFWPGGTEAEYRKNIEAVHPSTGLPEGQTFHAAGPTDGGFLIAAVWDSKEHADRFVQEILLPKMPLDGGLALTVVWWPPRDSGGHHRIRLPAMPPSPNQPPHPASPTD
jgi:hypothetical protein